MRIEEKRELTGKYAAVLDPQVSGVILVRDDATGRALNESVALMVGKCLARELCLVEALNPSTPGPATDQVLQDLADHYHGYGPGTLIVAEFREPKMIERILAKGIMDWILDEEIFRVLYTNAAIFFDQMLTGQRSQELLPEPLGQTRQRDGDFSEAAQMESNASERPGVAARSTDRVRLPGTEDVDLHRAKPGFNPTEAQVLSEMAQTNDLAAEDRSVFSSAAKEAARLARAADATVSRRLEKWSRYENVRVKVGIFDKICGAYRKIGRRNVLALDVRMLIDPSLNDELLMTLLHEARLAVYPLSKDRDNELFALRCHFSDTSSVFSESLRVSLQNAWEQIGKEFAARSPEEKVQKELLPQIVNLEEAWAACSDRILQWAQGLVLVSRGSACFSSERGIRIERELGSDANTFIAAQKELERAESDVVNLLKLIRKTRQSLALIEREECPAQVQDRLRNLLGSMKSGLAEDFAKRSRGAIALCRQRLSASLPQEEFRKISVAVRLLREDVASLASALDMDNPDSVQAVKSVEFALLKVRCVLMEINLAVRADNPADAASDPARTQRDAGTGNKKTMRLEVLAAAREWAVRNNDQPLLALLDVMEPDVLRVLGEWSGYNPQAPPDIAYIEMDTECELPAGYTRLDSNPAIVVHVTFWNLEHPELVIAHEEEHLKDLACKNEVRLLRRQANAGAAQVVPDVSDSAAAELLNAVVGSEYARRVNVDGIRFMPEARQRIEKELERSGRAGVMAPFLTSWLNQMLSEFGLDVQSALRIIREDPDSSTAAVIARAIEAEFDAGAQEADDTTEFFRESEKWELESFLDGLLLDKWRQRDFVLRFRHLSGSDGSEPYSVAILLAQALERLHSRLGVAGSLEAWIDRWDIRIDVFERRFAHLLKIREGSFVAVNQQRHTWGKIDAGRYFEFSGIEARAREWLRRWIRPVYIDLASPEQLDLLTQDRYDVTFALNILLYITEVKTQQEILNRLLASRNDRYPHLLVLGDARQRFPWPDEFDEKASVLSVRYNPSGIPDLTETMQERVAMLRAHSWEGLTDNHRGLLGVTLTGREDLSQIPGCKDNDPAWAPWLQHRWEEARAATPATDLPSSNRVRAEEGAAPGLIAPFFIWYNWVKSETLKRRVLAWSGIIENFLVRVLLLPLEWFVRLHFKGHQAASRARYPKIADPVINWSRALRIHLVQNLRWHRSPRTPEQEEFAFQCREWTRFALSIAFTLALAGFVFWRASVTAWCSSELRYYFFPNRTWLGWVDKNVLDRALCHLDHWYFNDSLLVPTSVVGTYLVLMTFSAVGYFSRQNASVSVFNPKGKVSCDTAWSDRRQLMKIILYVSGALALYFGVAEETGFYASKFRYDRWDIFVEEAGAVHSCWLIQVL